MAPPGYPGVRLMSRRCDLPVRLEIGDKLQLPRIPIIYT
jgi:hypothetical protein